MGCGNLMLRSARSRKSSCVVPSKDCLSNSAAAADANAEQRFFLPLQRMSGSGANGKSVRHTARHGTCSANAWYMVSKPESHSVGGFSNRRFEWRFCLLLPPWAKVGRARKRETSPLNRETPPSKTFTKERNSYENSNHLHRRQSRLRRFVLCHSHSPLTRQPREIDRQAPSEEAYTEKKRQRRTKLL